MYAIVDYERKHGGIILDSSQRPANIVTIKGESSRNPDIETNAFCFPVSNIHTSSPEYLYIMEKKAHLVVRMLENRQVLLSLLTILQFLIPKKGCSTAKASVFFTPYWMYLIKSKIQGLMTAVILRLGQQQLLQVLNKLLALASNARQSKADPKAWSNMVWNTNTFTKVIRTFWVYCHCTL